MAFKVILAALLASVANAVITGEDVGTYATCPDLWSINNGYCYRLIACELPYVQAEAECKLFGADSHLASIHSEEENDFVFTYQGGFVNMWIGLDDNRQPNVYEWIDGSPWDYSNWHTGQPNPDCGLLCEGHCAQFDVQSEAYTKWSLDDCNSAKMFVCKQPAMVVTKK